MRPLRSLCVLTWSIVAARPLPGQDPPKVGGYVQARFGDTGDSAVFTLNRARVGVDGTAAPWVTYKLQVELRNLGTAATPAAVAATDLFVAVRHAEWGVVAGQFKVPFSLEEYLSLSVLELPERTRIVTAQVPRRDVGAAVEWRPGRALLLQGGVFNGEGANRASNADRKMSYAARLVATPVAGLDVGGAAVTYPDSTWWGIQAAYRRAAWSGRAEFLRRERLGAGAADHSTGWYAQAAYRVRRNRLQLVGRVEQYDPSTATDGRETGYTAGAQYLVRGDDAKLQASYTAYDGTGIAVPRNPFIIQLQVRF